MAEDEVKIRKQIEHAQAKLNRGLKVYPKSIVTQDLLQQHQGIKAINVPVSIQRRDEEINQNEVQNEPELDINEIKIKQKNVNNTEIEQKLCKVAENIYQNGQIEHAQARLIRGLKVCPKSIATQDLLQQHQGIKAISVPFSIPRRDEEINQNEPELGLNEIKIKQKNGNNAEVEQQLCKIADNSLKMRQKMLIMEQKVVKTFCKRGLIENENDVRNNIVKIHKCVAKMYAARDFNDFVKIEKNLLIAESFSNELMKKVTMVVKKNTVEKEKVKNPEEDIEVPDYRSIVTVRGTKEDVSNCILKAKTAFGNGKYDRAEGLLLKAERIFPTKNARDLLEQVRAAKEPKQNTDPNVNSIQTVTVKTVKEKEDESKSEENSINAVKCLRAFEESFTLGSFVKAERLLNKAKRFDPSLDVEKKLSQVKTEMNNKTMEEKRKAEIEKAKQECKSAGECLYKSIKAYDAGDFVMAEQILLRAKSFDPLLNLESELSTIQTKMTSESGNGNKNIGKTEDEETVTERHVKYIEKYLYDAKKASDTRDFEEVLRNLSGAKVFDPSLNLEPYFPTWKVEIASRNSIEENPAILKQVPDTLTTYTKEAEIAFQSRDLNENTTLLNMAESCTNVNKIVKHDKNFKERNQAKRYHETTSSETKFLEDEKQKGRGNKRKEKLKRRLKKKSKK